ncbi:MAG: hypothetical protein IH886_04990 [Nitrospinae bacterium]|nr:hypothetical protein [Nitrospinota bacterium]
MSNELTLEEIEEWATAGIPVKNFTLSGPTMFEFGKEQPENLKEAVDNFVRLFISLEINFHLSPREGCLLFFNDKKLVAAMALHHGIMNMTLAGSIWVIPGLNQEGWLIDILLSCVEAFAWNLENRNRTEEPDQISSNGGDGYLEITQAKPNPFSTKSGR